MKHLLKLKLERMGIGDSLISPHGYAIDYIDGSGGTFHEPCYCLRRGTDILYMTANEHEADRKALVKFLADHPWPEHGLLAPGDEWRLEPSGSEANPVWDYPIGQLTMRNQRWLFSTSPHTGCRKTTDWMQIKRNHYPQLKDGSIMGVRTEFYHDGKVQPHDTYMIGRVYAVVEKICRGTASPPIGFVQLASIQRRQLASITKVDLINLGLASFEQFGLSRFIPEREYWALEYRIVWTDETLTQPAPILPLEPAQPLQMSYLVAV